MAVQELQEYLIQNPLWLVFGLAVLLVIILLLLKIVRHFQATAEERKINRTILRLSAQYMPNVIVPDDVDGNAYIDYLVLTPGGILVIDVQNYRGILFGAEKIDLWTQLAGRKSYKFENPLPHNQQRVLTVKALVEDVPVEGRVVFSCAGQFPKGIPEGVSMIDTLGADLPHMFTGQQVDDKLKAQWEKLRSVVSYQGGSGKSKKKDQF